MRLLPLRTRSCVLAATLTLAAAAGSAMSAERPAPAIGLPELYAMPQTSVSARDPRFELTAPLKANPAISAARQPGQSPGIDAIISPSPSWTYDGQLLGKSLGRSATTAGDVNGDGYSDVVTVQDSLSNTAKLYLFLGGPTGLTLAPGYPVYTGVNITQIAPAGDLNGDGFADLGVLLNNGTAARLRVYYGGANGYNMGAPFTATNIYVNGSASIGMAGDVNGDGNDDFLMGISNYGAQAGICLGSGPGFGRIDLYYGATGTGLAVDPQWIMLGCMWDAGAFAGASVGTAGDVNADGFDDIVIGAPYADPLGGPTSGGEAWVVYGAAGGLPLVPGFSNIGTLVGGSRIPGVQTGSAFGSTVATAGDANGDGYADIAVGAPDEDWMGTFTDNGAVRVYAGSASGVTTTELWYEVGPVDFNHFGSWIAPGGDLDGDGRPELLVGSVSNIAVPQSNGPIAPNFIIGTTLPYVGSFTRDFATAGDVNGDGLSDVIVGEGHYSGVLTGAGHIVLHLGRGSGPWQIAAWTTTTALENPNLGWSVASAGDVNGDGFDDVIYGAPTWDNFTIPGDVDNGFVAMAYGGVNGIDVVGSDFYGLGSSGDQAGIAVTGAIDFNGDGYSDIAAGAHQAAGVGKVRVWYGKTGGPTDQSAPNLTLTGSSPGGQFGAALAVGDFNGDGFGDLVVGAPSDDTPGTDVGRAFMYLGSAAGLSGTAAWTGAGGQVGELYGSALAGRGDLNGDGFTDLVVGSPSYDPLCHGFPCPDQGRLLEYRGSLVAPYLTLIRTINGSAPESFGSHIAHAGDVNGDGYGDIISGSPGAGAAGQGRADVFPGSPTGLVPGALWSQAGYENFGGFGSSVSGAGDSDGDGLSDVLVGAVFEDRGGAQDRGTARVFRGPLPNGAAPFSIIDGPSAFANVGHSVENGGDVNADGWPDLIMGLPGYSDVAFRQGLVRVHNGAHYGRVALSYMADPLGRMVPMSACEPAGFLLVNFARSAAGRARVRLQWQAEPSVGLPAASLSGIQPAYTLTNAPAGLGSYAILGAGPLVPGAGIPYSWRVRSLSRSVYFPTTAWVSPPLSGAREYDVRRVGTWVAVDDALTGAEMLAMSDAYPNPSRGGSELQFTLPLPSDISLVVLDVQGRKVRTLLTGAHTAGPHRARWDGRNERGGAASAGLYFYRLEIPGESPISRKVALVR